MASQISPEEARDLNTRLRLALEANSQDPRDRITWTGWHVGKTARFLAEECPHCWHPNPIGSESCQLCGVILVEWDSVGTSWFPVPLH